MIEIIDKNGNRLFSIYEISKLIGLSKSTTRRIILTNSIGETASFKNELYYDKLSLFNVMEKVLIKRLIKINELQ